MTNKILSVARWKKLVVSATVLVTISSPLKFQLHFTSTQPIRDHFDWQNVSASHQ